MPSVCTSAPCTIGLIRTVSRQGSRTLSVTRQGGLVRCSWPGAPSLASWRHWTRGMAGPRRTVQSPLIALLALNSPSAPCPWRCRWRSIRPNGHPPPLGPFVSARCETCGDPLCFVLSILCTRPFDDDTAKASLNQRSSLEHFNFSSIRSRPGRLCLSLPLSSTLTRPSPPELVSQSNRFNQPVFLSFPTKQLFTVAANHIRIPT